MRVDFQVCKTSQISPLKAPLRPNGMFFNYGCDVVSFGNHKDLIQQPVNDIIKTVEKSIKPVNLLGRGGEAAVYNIEGTGYCVRIPHDLPDDYQKGL